MSLNPSTVVENHQLKSRKMVFECSITAHATPASKKHASDLPGTCLLATEGKLTDVSGEEDITGLTGYTAPVDNSAGDSIFDILIKGSDIGSIKKVMKVSVTEKTALATSLTVTKLGDSFGLTAEGNVAVEVAGAGLTLATESPTFVVELDVLLSE